LTKTQEGVAGEEGDVAVELRSTTTHGCFEFTKVASVLLNNKFA
jgi:hypothetical protein